MKCAVLFCLLLSIFSYCVFAESEVYKIESCATHLEAQQSVRKYRTLMTRRSVPCTVTVSSGPDNAIKLEFHNLRKACELKPQGIVIIEEGSDPISMCESEMPLFVSEGSKIIIEYSTSTGMAFEISKVRNKIGCKETLDYSYYGRSLTLTSSEKNETCFVAFPGRTLVVMEEIELEKDECESHVNIMTGRDFFTYNYRLRQYCRKDNGEVDDDTLVICPRGLLLFQAAANEPESIRFRLEIPVDERPLLIHSLEC